MNAYAVIACVAVCGLVLSGCAAGRGPGGEVIVGFDVAKLPEGATQLAAHAAGFLPEPWGTIASGVVLSVGGVLAGNYRGRRVGERAGWDEAESARRANERDTLLAVSDPAVAARVVTAPAGVGSAGPAVAG